MSLTTNQRSDYTFKYNQKLGRHGWLRLTPAYSVKLVKELVEDTPKNSMILDPFSGTATTGVVAAEIGMNAHLFDINPFLIWLGNVKCTSFNSKELEYLTDELLIKIIADYRELTLTNNWSPNIHNIERWWCGHTLPLISALRESIVINCGHPKGTESKNLIWVAFMRLIIETSSAAFNHVSMSFQGGVTRFEIDQIQELFTSIVHNIALSANQTMLGKSQIFLCDSRTPQSQDAMTYDHVITSPPYPNRMTYIRELRPYMYWAGFLDEAKEAGELDWKAIGGTWGTATSKLKTWVNDEDILPDELTRIVEIIAKSGDKNSDLMAQYVFKYFSDMHKHFSGLRNILNDGAKVDYIIGNSSFYGNLVKAEAIMGSSLEILGFTNVSSKIVRKRNCNKELYEFCLSARWK
jgi:hypothetical protein